MTFKGKKVLIAGLGRLGGGVGAVKFFHKQGAVVKVTDLKGKKELKESLEQLKNIPVAYVLGKHNKEDFIKADLILKNPGVPSSSVYIREALKRKIRVEMTESLFVKLSKTNKVIGVTGTRGKSTVSSLIYKGLKKAKSDVYLSGNMAGSSVLDLLEQINQESIVILELSSWQLEGFGWSRISPSVAVITNIFPDHLNRYQSMSDYIYDKENIFKYQTKKDFLFLNRVNKYSKSFAQKTKSKVIWFDQSDFPRDWELSLLGSHNLENAACAYKVAKLFHVPDSTLKSVFSNFQTLPFRLQKIGNFSGRLFVNDSTSTTPTALIAALSAFPSDKVILICGGNDKKLPFAEAGEEVGKRCKTVVFLKGTGTNLFLPLIQKKMTGRVFGPYHDLKEAIKKSYSLSKKGDIILFSPGFTSFSMFANEFDRGEKFNNEIKAFFKKSKKN